MDYALLVKPDIESGREILNALDEKDVKVDVALWSLFLREYGNWRLVLASRQLDRLDLRKAYGTVYSALDEAGIESEKNDPIMIFRMKDPFVRDLRRSFERVKNPKEGRSLAGTIGDRFVDHSYIYRVS